jgi:oxygen-dependent protoporphyrinogen oxidase
VTTLVIGGGMSGLVAARALARTGEDVRLLESSDRVGGVVRTLERDGFLMELGPNTVRPTRELLELVSDLGLEGEVLLSDSRAPRYLAWRGALHALPSSPASLLRTPLLSVRGKLRLLAEPFVPRRREAAEETVRDFFSRRTGWEVEERFVAPFVSGIFAGDPARLSAEAAFPALVRGEREHGSLLGALVARRRARPKASMRVAARVRGLLSFRKGLETLPRALAASLGDRVETGARVRAMSPRDGRWMIEGPAGASGVDRVILACPADEAASLVAGFAPGAAAALSGIPQPPVAILHFAWPKTALRAPLVGFGHLVVRAPGLRVLGAVWSSSIFPGRAPAGDVLVTAFAGGATDPSGAEMPDASLVARAAQELAGALDAKEEPRLLCLTRWPRAIPQYELGHPDRIAALSRAEAHWPGLTFLGAYRGGISVGDVVHGALAVAQALPRRA